MLKSLDEYFPSSRNKELGAKYIVLDSVSKPRTRDYLSLECKECGFKFNQRANSVFLGVVSCKCSKSYRLSKKDVESKLQDICKVKGLTISDIQILSPTCNSMVCFTCNCCGKSSSKTYSNLVYSGVGCTHCTNKYRPTFLEGFLKISERLLGKFEIIDCPQDRISNNSQILLECVSCKVQTLKAVKTILHQDSGCPCSATWGFNPSIENFMYLIEIKGDNTFYKIGVTNNLKRRFREISRSNEKEVDVISTWKYLPNSSILEHERLIKSYFSTPDLLDPQHEIVHGRTELVSQESLPTLIAIQSLQGRQRYGFTS